MSLWYAVTKSGLVKALPVQRAEFGRLGVYEAEDCGHGLLLRSLPWQITDVGAQEPLVKHLYRQARHSEPALAVPIHVA